MKSAGFCASEPLRMISLLWNTFGSSVIVEVFGCTDA